MLTQHITNDMKAAMKAKDSLALGAIRMLRSAIKDKEIELGRAVEDADVIAVVSKLIKQRKDAAAQYMNANRPELAEKEYAEIKVLEVYMPEPMSDAEIQSMVEAVIAETGASSMQDMGKVMGMVREKAQGRADMGKVSATVKAALQ